MIPSNSSLLALPGDDLTQRLHDEQMALLCRLSQPALIASAVVALYVVWLLLSEHSWVAVGGWYLALVGITAVRLVIQTGYLSAFASERRAIATPRLRRVVLAGIAANGLAWSIPSTLLFSSEPVNQILMAVFLVGLSAAAMSSLAPLRFGYASFLVPFMVPIALNYWLIGAEFINVAFGIGVYVAAMLAAANRTFRSVEQTLRLQLENEALAERVQNEKAVVERANRDLEAQIAQREHTEAELRVAKSKAESANRAKSQFLANMSHELRTPLNGILGMSELLLRTPLDAKQTKFAQTVRNSGDRLLLLIDDILDMARIEAGALRVAAVTYSPRGVVMEVVESMAEQAATKNLSLSSKVDDDVPEDVLGDPDRVRQVLVNLVSNAIKFTDSGGIRIELKQSSATGSQIETYPLLRWSVADTGIGIDDRVRESLFLPFSQADESVTRRYGGTGLGLAICRQIVSALGGRIDFTSQPGLGSTFWFEVPLRLGAHVEPPPANAHALAPARPGANILVVEDNQTNRQLVVEMLELSGYAVTAVGNGAEALRTLESKTFDAVLMDWHMPEMDGLAATRALRARESAARTDERTRTPVIALTASVLPGDRHACQQAGMDDFLPKPFTYDELIVTVQRWVPSPQREALSNG